MDFEFIEDPPVVATETSAGIYFVPSVMTRAPELTIPGRKPIGPVEVDKQHPLARGAFSFYDGLTPFCRGENDAVISKPSVVAAGATGYLFDGSTETFSSSFFNQSFDNFILAIEFTSVSGSGAYPILRIGGGSNYLHITRLTTAERITTDITDTVGNFYVADSSSGVVENGERIRVVMTIVDGEGHSFFHNLTTGQREHVIDAAAPRALDTDGDIQLGDSAADVVVHQLMFAGGALPLDLAKNLAFDPYQFLVPRK